MIQQIYDDNFGPTHEFNIKGSVFAETGGPWNLIVPNSVFFNNYKKNEQYTYVSTKAM